MFIFIDIYLFVHKNDSSRGFRILPSSCASLFDTIICSISTEHEDNIGKLIAIYTIFSCIPFMVNLFLATRFFYNKYGDQILTANQLRENQLIDYNRVSAYYIYLLCCIGNWLYHGVFLLNRLWLFDFGLSYLVYYALLVPIINDDLVLLSWLKSKRLDL